MALRILVADQDVEAVKLNLERALAPRCYAPIHDLEFSDEPAKELHLAMEIVDGGVCLRPAGAPRSLMESVAQALAAAHGAARLLECEIVSGSQGEEVRASETHYDAEGGQQYDLDDEATEIVATWLQDGPLYEEEEASEELAWELLGQQPMEQELLGFRCTVAPRLASILEAVENGGKAEWTELAGRTAIRVEMSTSERQIAVLSDDEVVELKARLPRP